MNGDYDWREDAVCAQTDPDMFFPEQGGNVQSVKQICRACPVAMQCLQFATDNVIQEGIWGGLGPVERRRLRVSAA